MSGRNRGNLKSLLVLAGLAVTCLGLMGCTARTETGQIDVWDPQGITDFVMRDQNNQKVTKKDLLGRPWLACFVFTRCQLTCPRLTGEMDKLSQEFKGTNLRLVSFTVDPEHDTPEVLARWARKANADPDQWKFLTSPDKGQLYNLVHKSFKVPLQERDEPDLLPTFRIIHSNLLMYVDETGRVRGKYNGLSDKDLAEVRRFLKTPPLVRHFPLVNASLNGLAGVLLVLGFWQIRQKWAQAHKRTMIAAFFVSVAFLGCYLTYHAYAGSKHFDRGDVSEDATEEVKARAKAEKYTYLTLLATHVVLAAFVPFLAVGTIWQGLRAEKTGNWPRHRRLAWITFPIWLYVSVTGVLIYLMLYRPETLGLT